MSLKEGDIFLITPKHIKFGKVLETVPEKPLVSVIIVNWNGKEHLQKCLPSLYEQSYKDIEVIVVDNASDDGSIEYIKENFRKVKILTNEKNLGFAEANNVGYLVSKGEYILFLNNDTEVTKNFLIKLIGVLASNKKIAGVQSKIFLMDEKDKLDSVGAFLTNSGFLYHYGIRKKDSKKYKKQIGIYSAKGACMMFRKNVLERAKIDSEIFDSKYFAYFEETDLCHRVWLAGFRIIFVPDSIIYHKMGATSSRLKNPFIQFHSYKNRINSYIKNLGILNLIKILPIHILLCELVSVIYLFQGNFETSFSIQRAIFWNLLNLKNTLQKRSFVQRKIRLLRDSEFFPMIIKNVELSYYFHLFRGLEEYEDK